MVIKMTFDIFCLLTKCFKFSLFLNRFEFWKMCGLVSSFHQCVLVGLKSWKFIWSAFQPTKMSVFFFRVHNLQRGSANKIRNIDVHERRNRKVYQHNSDDILPMTSASKLFERTPTNPKDRDSLDDVAIHIKRLEF